MHTMLEHIIAFAVSQSHWYDHQLYVTYLTCVNSSVGVNNDTLFDGIQRINVNQT